MFSVLEQVDTVESEDISGSNDYVVERRGSNFDRTIDAGSGTASMDPSDQLIRTRETASTNPLPDFWMPIEDWKLD